MERKYVIADLKEAIRLLSLVEPARWAELFVYLKIGLNKILQDGMVFSTSFGADFFHETLRRVEANEPIPCKPGATYDENFNRWLKNLK